MKKGKLAVIFMLLILLAGCDVGCPKPPPHVGQWIDRTLQSAVVFNNDGTFEVMYFNDPDPSLELGQSRPQRPDDKTWKVDFRGTYVIDFSKNPAWIDLVFTKQGTPRRAQGLITFLDNNTFYVAFEDVRPASLDNSSRKERYTRAAPNEIGPLSK